MRDGKSWQFCDITQARLGLLLSHALLGVFVRKKQFFFIEVGFTSTFLNLGEQAMKKKYKLTKKLWDNNGRLRKDS